MTSVNERCEVCAHLGALQLLCARKGLRFQQLCLENKVGVRSGVLQLLMEIIGG